MSDVTRFIGDDGSRYEKPGYRFEYNGSLDEAQGSLGVTYLVRDQANGKVVALAKRFKSTIEANERRAYRDAEANSLRRLGGADGHAPRLLATGVCSGPDLEDLPSILMERVDGITLRHALREGALAGGRSGSGQTESGFYRLDATSTVRVARKIADAIAACHAAGGDLPVVHRDLSLDNIMVSVRPDGAVENAALIDFGQAVLETGTIGRLGTAFYSAPEIFGGRFSHETRNQRPWREQPTADVWSLGVITYVMRTGMKPFAGEALFNVKDSYPRFMRNNSFTLLKDLYPEGFADERLASEFEDLALNTALDAFIAICTAYDPNRRFQSMEEARDALDEILNDPHAALGHLNDIKERGKRAPGGDTGTVLLTENPQPAAAPEKPREADAAPKVEGADEVSKAPAPATQPDSPKKKASSQKKNSSPKQSSVPMATPVSYSAASSPAVSRPSASGRSSSGSSTSGPAKAAKAKAQAKAKPKPKAKPTLLERIDPKVAWFWYLTIVAIGASWAACLYLELRPPVELWTFTVVATILGVPTCCWAFRARRDNPDPTSPGPDFLAVFLTLVLLAGAALRAHRDIAFLIGDIDLPLWIPIVIAAVIVVVIVFVILFALDRALGERPRVFYIPATLVIIAVSAALGLASAPAVDLMVREKVAQGVEATNFGDWGPKDRQTFTQDEVVPYATINSVVDDPTWGDERVFARIREAGTDDEFTNGIVVSPGKTYEVVVLLHNNASAATRSGAAHDAMLSVDCPDNVPGGAVLSSIDATIYSHSTDPELIRSSIALESYEPVAVDYVRGSYEFHGDLYSGYDIHEWMDWGPYVEDDSHCLELSTSVETLNGGMSSAAYVRFELEVSLPG